MDAFRRLDPRARGRERKLVSQNLAGVLNRKVIIPGLLAPRRIKYMPSANWGMVTPQKKAPTILFFNVIAYILDPHSLTPHDLTIGKE
jgi:hypothetical protein